MTDFPSTRPIDPYKDLKIGNVFVCVPKYTLAVLEPIRQNVNGEWINEWARDGREIMSLGGESCILVAKLTRYGTKVTAPMRPEEVHELVVLFDNWFAAIYYYDFQDNFQAFTTK